MSLVEKALVEKALRGVSALGIMATPFVMDGCSRADNAIAAEEFSKKTIQFQPDDTFGQGFLETSTLTPTLVRRLSSQEAFNPEYGYKPNTVMLYKSLVPFLSEHHREVWLLMDEKLEDTAGYREAVISARLVNGDRVVDLYIRAVTIGTAYDVLGLKRYRDFTSLKMTVDAGYAVLPALFNEDIWNWVLQISIQKAGHDSQLLEIAQVPESERSVQETEHIL